MGYRVRMSFDNVAGSFVDTRIQRRDDWEYSEWDAAVNRGLAYPAIQALGGLSFRQRTDRDVEELPEGVDLETVTVDSWVGWNFSLRRADDYGRKRIRLVPAFRHEHTDFLHPARDLVEDEDPEDFWRDSNRYLSQLTLLAVDYHATNLVYSYGETEDVPSGAYLAPVFGWESTELRDRLYHAIGAAWTNFTEKQRFFYATADYGGWRNEGRFEDGSLNLATGGFSALTERSYGYWRHFVRLNYSLGINRTDPAGLRLDALALRDLDNSDIAGDHRLTLMLESLLFTRYSFLGFKAAAFAYAAGGFVGPEDEALLDERFSANVGIGIRLNNPLLAIPTTEARIGLLSTERWCGGLVLHPHEGREPVPSGTPLGHPRRLRVRVTTASSIRAGGRSRALWLTPKTVSVYQAVLTDAWGTSIPAPFARAVCPWRQVGTAGRR